VNVDFELDGATAVRITLIDLQGRIVADLPIQNLPTGTHRLPVATQDLAAGTYLLRLQRGAAVDVLKVVLDK
jgi:hypothetical protein